MDYIKSDYKYSTETGTIIGIAMEVHRILGRGFAEIVYKDALSYELTAKNMLFEREKEFVVNYKSIILPHKFYADFVVYDKIILKIKSKKGIVEEHVAQVINYLAISGCKVGLILNFGEHSLVCKRLVL
ncbi:MAG: GxxExxY protein [Bacteroidetes bacterium]|nr:GxxExxY protein [Bacteroidota bacterium]